MAVVRLELDVPDNVADTLAADLNARYIRVSALPDGWRAAMIRVLGDDEIRRERDILRALAWFLPS